MSSFLFSLSAPSWCPCIDLCWSLFFSTVRSVIQYNSKEKKAPTQTGTIHSHCATSCSWRPYCCACGNSLYQPAFCFESYLRLPPHYHRIVGDCCDTFDNRATERRALGNHTATWAIVQPGTDMFKFWNTANGSMLNSVDTGSQVSTTYRAPVERLGLWRIAGSCSSCAGHARATRFLCGCL